eukprot:3028977-Amphidinium_carterae.1
MCSSYSVDLACSTTFEHCLGSTGQHPIPFERYIFAATWMHIAGHDDESQFQLRLPELFIANCQWRAAAASSL